MENFHHLLHKRTVPDASRCSSKSDKIRPAGGLVAKAVFYAYATQTRQERGFSPSKDPLHLQNLLSNLPSILTSSYPLVSVHTHSQDTPTLFPHVPCPVTLAAGRVLQRATLPSAGGDHFLKYHRRPLMHHTTCTQ
jgi:hypothetical protein